MKSGILAYEQRRFRADSDPRLQVSHLQQLSASFSDRFFNVFFDRRGMETDPRLRLRRALRRDYLRHRIRSQVQSWPLAPVLTEQLAGSDRPWLAILTAVILLSA